MGRKIRAVVIGASAGGIEALSFVLAGLKPTCEVPVLIVLHLPQTRESRLLTILGSKSTLPVIEVEDKQPLKGDCVFVAPADYHLLVEDEFTLALSSDVPVNYSRPSIDVLFESAVDVFGGDLIGVVLTGANRDGAEGLAKIIASGGIGVVQDPISAHSRVMPDAAIAQSDLAHVLELDQIPRFLNSRI
jgi:two-component system, chemotaxis family, protein-glutamate methylesterase/glutaminase